MIAYRTCMLTGEWGMTIENADDLREALCAMCEEVLQRTVLLNVKTSFGWHKNSAMLGYANKFIEAWATVTRDRWVFAHTDVRINGEKKGEKWSTNTPMIERKVMLEMGGNDDKTQHTRSEETCDCVYCNRVIQGSPIAAPYLMRMAYVPLLINWLSSSFRAEDTKDEQQAIKVLFPIGKVLQKLGLLRIPPVLIDGFLNTAAKADELNDPNITKTKNKLLRTLALGVGGKDSVMANFRECVDWFFKAVGIEVYGRRVDVTPIATEKSHVLGVLGKVILMLWPLECIAKDRMVEVADMQVQKSGVRGWQVWDVKVKNITWQSSGLEFADREHPDLDPTEKLRANSKADPTWMTANGGFFQSIEHFKGSRKRAVVSKDLGEDGVQGFVEGDDVVDADHVVFSVFEAVNLSMKEGSLPYNIQAGIHHNEMVDLIMDRIEMCYLLDRREADNEGRSRARNMMASEYFAMRYLDGLIRFFGSGQEGKAAMRAELSVILARVKWFPIPEQSWSERPNQGKLRIVTILDNGDPVIQEQAFAKEKLVKMFSKDKHLYESTLDGSESPTRDNRNVMFRYDAFMDGKCRDVSFIVQTMMSVLHIRYDNFLLRSQIDQYLGEDDF